MAFDDFYDRFHKGELGDDGDFFEWSVTSDMYQELIDLLEAEIGS